MTVTVRLFASYAEALGMREMALQVDVGATVQDVLSSVCAMPGASRLPPSPLVAVNHTYARGSQILFDGDEVALIPPVAGG